MENALHVFFLVVCFRVLLLFSPSVSSRFSLRVVFVKPTEYIKVLACKMRSLLARSTTKGRWRFNGKQSIMIFLHLVDITSYAHFWWDWNLRFSLLGMIGFVHGVLCKICCARWVHGWSGELVTLNFVGFSLHSRSFFFSILIKNFFGKWYNLVLKLD